MDGFIKVGNTLINTTRLLIIEHKQAEKTDRFSQPEHYLAVFDTGQNLMLTPEEGSALVSRSIADQAVGG